MQRNDVEKLLARLIDPSNISLHLVLRRRAQPYLRELLDAINNRVFEVLETDFNYLQRLLRHNTWTDSNLLTIEIFLAEKNIPVFLDLSFLQYVDNIIKGPDPDFPNYDFSCHNTPLEKEIKRYNDTTLTKELKKKVGGYGLRMCFEAHTKGKFCDTIIYQLMASKKINNKVQLVVIATVEVDCWAKNIRLNGVNRVPYKNERSVTYCIEQVLLDYVDEQAHPRPMYVPL